MWETLHWWCQALLQWKEVYSVACHKVVHLLFQLLLSAFPILARYSCPQLLHYTSWQTFAFHLQLPVTQSLLTVLKEHQSLPSQYHMWYCHLLSETAVTARKSTSIFKDFNNAVIIPIKKKCKNITNRRLSFWAVPHICTIWIKYNRFWFCNNFLGCSWRKVLAVTHRKSCIYSAQAEQLWLI